ncbi:hypothetical protein BLOT_015871 [Blomia tropicalis]|nr:hypothetical protein BLOT_015871 [Blomia tropicalis]
MSDQKIIIRNSKYEYKTRLMKYIRKHLSNHFCALFVDLDAAQCEQLNPGLKMSKEEWENEHRPYRIQMAILAIVFVLICIDEYNSIPQLDIGYFINNPYIMFHQITPKMIWRQTDPIFFMSTFHPFFIYITMIFNYKLPNKFCYFHNAFGDGVCIDNRIQNVQVSQRIKRISRNGRRTIRWSTYIFSNLCNFVTRLNMIHHVIKYNKMNEEINHICREIKCCSRFWSPFLTIMMPYYVGVQCFLIHLVVYSTNPNAMQTYLYMVVFINMVLYMFMLIHQCAEVVRNNNRLTANNRKFFIIIQQYNNTFKRGKRVPLSTMLKMENRLWQHPTKKYAFKLFTNYAITSKTFHLILTYISLGFFFVNKPKAI